jgi:predicted aconitase with swiveling domain
VTSLKLEVLVAGEPGRGEALVLSAPISFWGGVNPRTGDIVLDSHPEKGCNVAGKVLAIPGTVGSSSASYVLMELVHAGLAPAAILMPEPDAILLLGLVCAREMGWKIPTALRMSAAEQAALKGRFVEVYGDGRVHFLTPPSLRA